MTEAERSETEASAEPPAGPPAARDRLDRSLASGIAWTGGIKWATQILSWAGTIVVARLLTPAEFGLVGTANVVIGLLDQMSEFGLGVAIIRRRLTDRAIVAQLNTVTLAIGATFAALAALLAYPVASLFKQPAVEPVLRWLSLTFLLGGFRAIPRAVLSRDLRYRRVATLDACDVITATVVTLALALAGFRHWAIVGGLLSGTAVSAALAVGWARTPFALPTAKDRVAAEMRYGLHVVGGRIAWYSYNQADFAVVARMLGNAALGFYSFGWQIASIPVQRVAAIVNQVAGPVFARVQDRPAELARYLLLLNEGLAFVALPFSAGLVLTAPELVHVALGSQWAPAILPLQLLGLYAAVRTVTTLLNNVLQAVGHAREVMYYTAGGAIVLPLAFAVGAAAAGTAGVALAWVIAYPIAITPAIRLVLRVTKLSFLRYLAPIWPAALATGAMAAAVLVVRVLLPAELSTVLRLGAMVATGVVVYGLIILIVFGGRARRFVQALRAPAPARTT